MKDSNKHFFYKLGVNFVRIPVSFALQSIFPRILGPVNYGNFDFLTDSATKFIGFFETGTSIAFYTNLSINNKDYKLVKFYWRLVFFISFGYLIFVIASGFFQVSQIFWPDQNFYFIFLSAIWGVVTFCSNTIYKMLDACHVTIASEKFRMIHLIFSVCIFACFYFLSINISLVVFFIIQILLILILFGGSWYILTINGFEVFPKIELSSSDLFKFKNLFWTFSSPLLLYALFSLVGGVGERWILQRFGGAVQQAHYGISYKVGSFVFLFTSAMIPIMLREFSKLFGTNDLEEIKKYFIKTIKTFLILATSLAVLVAFNAEFITLILGGQEFKGAILVVALMAFYPIHQTIGQINATLFFSTKRTKNYRNIGLFIIPIGLSISFFLIAPKSYGGLNLGAYGLVCQMLIVQLISTNIMLFSNSKYLKMKYSNFVLIQILTIGSLIFLSYGLQLFVDIFKFGLLLRAITFSILLFGILLISFTIFPNIIGFNIPWNTFKNHLLINKKKE